MGLTIYCKLCQVAQVGATEFPAICPSCKQEAIWLVPSGPRSLQFTQNDCKYLKSIKIDPEELTV